MLKPTEDDSVSVEVNTEQRKSEGQKEFLEKNDLTGVMGLEFG